MSRVDTRAVTGRDLALERVRSRLAAGGMPGTAQLTVAQLEAAAPQLGIALEPAPATEAAPPDVANLDVETACATLAKAAGWSVEILSRPFATKGYDMLPDQRWRIGADEWRRCWVCDAAEIDHECASEHSCARRASAVWVECKSAKDRLTKAQHDWLLRESAAGQLVLAGGEMEVRAWLAAWALGEDVQALGLRFIARIAEKGWRT